MTTFEQLAKDRYSVRAFSNQEVEPEKIQRIIEVANLAPTATNAQAFHIWAFHSPEDIRKLNRSTPCGFGASWLLVLGVKPQEGWIRKEDDHPFADVDGGIVGTHILFAAVEEGLGTTWVGRMNPAQLTEDFPEMEGYELIGIFPIGYAADTPAGQPGKNHETRKALSTISTFPANK